MSEILKNMINVADEVRKLLKDDDGHGWDHVERVRRMAHVFAEAEGADTEIVDLAAMLHDVDDYKIFGQESANNLTNATRILSESGTPPEINEKVLSIIRSMGYNKYLEGIRPQTLEGMIVSDADMCDSIGSQGILRTYMYNVSLGNPFFDKQLVPISEHLSAEEYRALKTGHSVQHFFDKLLKVSSILMTKSGREEGAKRQRIMVEFLRELFREDGASEWEAHLESYVKK